MAVTLPSDLILDVMRSADPARLRSATAKLANAGGVEHSFAAMVDSRPRDALWPLPRMGTASDTSLTGAEHLPRADADDAKAASSAYAGFERLLLGSMFKDMLPSAGADTFGSGLAGDVWRSMAADELAGVFARSGGIGVARMLAGEPGSGKLTAADGWPYFGTRSITSFQPSLATPSETSS